MQKARTWRQSDFGHPGVLPSPHHAGVYVLPLHCTVKQHKVVVDEPHNSETRSDDTRAKTAPPNFHTTLNLSLYKFNAPQTLYTMGPQWH
ncbi:hypothetical protein TNCV_3909171 [Trichonephila clavipes]|nr:hypothetical protein TNCV_3909171 [Trichonephila clavipes]